jgi:hypothetical protein
MVFNFTFTNRIMKKLILFLFLLPLIAQAQVNGTIQRTSATGIVRYFNSGAAGIDTLVNAGIGTNGFVPVYNSTLKKSVWTNPTGFGTNFWSRNVGTSTLSPAIPNDKLNMGTGSITGGVGSFTSSGSTGAATITQSSGSGVGLTITKGGNGEGLIVNKTSGSGNAVTVTGTAEATTLVKTGGTGAQFLMGNGTTQDTTTIQTVANFFPKGDTRYARTGSTGTVTSVSALTLGTTGTDLSSTVANGTTTPVITLNVPNASATARGVVTTETQTFAGLKSFNTNIEVGSTGTSGKLLLKRSSDGAVASIVEQVNDNKLTLTSSGGTRLFDINADRIDFNSTAATATYWFGQNRPTATEVLINGSNNNKLILQNNEVAQLTLNSNGGTITAASVGSSGDVIVGANNSGLIGKIAVGSGLSLSSGTLTATGGSSGSVTTAGGTAGKIAKFTSASNIENSIMTESGSDLSVSGTVTATTFNGSGSGLTSVVNSITGTSNQVVASASTGAVTLSLPQSIATTSTPQFTSIGLGTAPSYTLDATKSVSSNYIAHLHNTNTTAGDSFGLFIKAGTNGSDYPLNVNTADNSINLFNLTGSGDAMIKNDVTSGGTNGFSAKSLLIGTDGTIANYRWQTSLSGNNEIFASRSFGTVRTTNYTTGATVYSGTISATNLSGTNTGDQTTITGNAGTATALQTARTIQGVSFDGTANINPINGTGFVKASGTTLSYDNTITSGTYTPTLTNDLNVSGASNDGDPQYQRIGNIVTVFGSVSFTMTTTGNCLIGISLPIASNFTSTTQAHGMGVSFKTVSTNAVVSSDATNDRVSLSFVANAAETQTFRYSFSYQVL